MFWTTVHNLLAQVSCTRLVTNRQEEVHPEADRRQLADPRDQASHLPRLVRQVQSALHCSRAGVQVECVRVGGAGDQAPAEQRPRARRAVWRHAA